MSDVPIAAQICNNADDSLNTRKQKGILSICAQYMVRSTVSYLCSYAAIHLVMALDEKHLTTSSNKHTTTSTVQFVKEIMSQN
jgi:hypothetical protein